MPCNGGPSCLPAKRPYSYFDSASSNAPSSICWRSSGLISWGRVDREPLSGEHYYHLRATLHLVEEPLQNACRAYPGRDESPDSAGTLERPASPDPCTLPGPRVSSPLHNPQNT